MKFAIFTSFYNYLDTFDELVESVLNQTYTNWEWIVSDDFSENPIVMEKLNDLVNNHKNIRLIQPKEKKEFYWNPPTTETDADIFMVLDSDDLLLPKTLEVYKHNFDKFKDVQMICCNSLLRWGNIKGEIYSTRYINFKDNCNITDKMKNSKDSEYSIGDLRAWRNKIKVFEDKQKWVHCAEDVLKTLVNEEIGKILYIPRVLHNYAHRVNSISKEIIYEHDIYHEPDRMIENAEIRKSREDLNSVEEYYDTIFETTTPFYFCDFNDNKKTNIIEYFEIGINQRTKEKLKNLYFEQDIRFKTTPFADYLVIKIKSIEDLPHVSDRLNYFLPEFEIVLECDNEIKDDVTDLLNKSGLSYWWFIETKTIFKIRIK